MKIIFYLIVGFLSLAFIPIAAPIVLIVAIIHMLEGKRSRKQKKLITDTIKEANLKK